MARNSARVDRNKHWDMRCKKIENEANNKLSNLLGTIAMARTSDPHSATAQFFINTEDNPGLDFQSETEQGWGYCVFGEVVDGMDVLKVREPSIKAGNYVRSGKGPYILEMQTYRFKGHSMSDPAKYRTKEEVQRVRSEQDPIDQLREKILRSGLADEDVLKTFDREVKRVVTEAAEFAERSPEPEPSELYSDVLAGA